MIHNQFWILDSLKGLFIIVVISNSVDTGPGQRYALSECSYSILLPAFEIAHVEELSIFWKTFIIHSFLHYYFDFNLILIYNGGLDT